MANTKKTSEMRLLIITVLMINAVLSTPVVRRDATCQDPTHHHLRSLLHPSGSNLTSFEPNLPVSTSMPSLSCPTGALQGSNLMLNQRATCPWVYVEQRNETRHPRTITQAVCYDCTGCLRGRHGQEHPDSTCQPIYYQMKVLWRNPESDCVDGEYTYRVGVENVQEFILTSSSKGA
ncbi:uncharacterized protein [Asterias amurensis]|uniref:uncharacterized protein n=1 Tax=Asterias amurensis TaxID=7602 RepID=UPI003AB6EC60